MSGHTRLAAFLRAVNVGGNRKLPMASLRDGLVAAGCTDVATYIQSGNVVATVPAPAARADAWCTDAISTIAGFAVPVITRTAKDLAAVVKQNPYAGEDLTHVHVVFFARGTARTLEGVDVAGFAPEHATPMGADLYLLLPNGMGRAKLPVALERAHKRAGHDPGTARNWKTVLTMRELLDTAP